MGGVSGFCGEGFGFSWGSSRAFVRRDSGLGFRGESVRAEYSGIRREDLGFRGGKHVAFVGFGAFGKESGFRRVASLLGFRGEDFGLSWEDFDFS